ncbi:hypothetical protein EDC28_104173 [Gallaecimonas pentaromativorans]|uniref:Uncharacterized protein n=1 Tax=Gallaecimonas pentaromativorans TaxID=584787 RepID=A0A3N1PFZ7_9GAMM|nr:hypothetical protein EDC28_104173 [Gallaecimonas pentaromativorans]
MVTEASPLRFLVVMYLMLSRVAVSVVRHRKNQRTKADLTQKRLHTLYIENWIAEGKVA